MDKAALIIAGGKKPGRHLIKEYVQKSDYIIAADKGGDYLKSHKIVPYALVGDFDSINKKSLSWFEKNNVHIHKTNVEKDETDTMIAIMLALGLGVKTVYILGALGERLDHQIANISILSYSKNKGIDAWLVDDNNQVFLLDGNIKLAMNKGDNFSIFAITDSVKFNYSKGLKYPLDGLVIEQGNPIGVSNVVLSGKVEVDIENGRAMVVLSK